MENTAEHSTGATKLRSGYTEEDASDEDAGYRVFSREEAQALRMRSPGISLWGVLCIQGVVGAAVIALSLLFSEHPGSVASAASGVFAAWLPAGLFVWRLAPRAQDADMAAFMQLRFFFWEAVKILCSVALLGAAVAWVRPLNWLALMAGFIVTVKAYSLACWLSLATNRRVKS